MIGKLRIALATALVLAAGNAWALGLGQIEVKSRRNQPLLAEIPIVSTTPGELQALQARLASPETFRRVGLSPPTGLAADLQFSLGSDARGRPVIRVTTVRPVDQSVLTFLVEVDWGQGRLVREYSALVDAPQTASAPVPATVQVPATPEPALVQRPAVTPAPVAETLPEPEPLPPPTPSATPEPEQVADAPAAVEPEPLPESAAVAPSQPLPAPQPAPVIAPKAADASSQYGPVRRGETLSAIASGLDVRGATSLEQTMLALLRANPDAFLGDDINRLKQGAVLRVPDRGAVAGIDADEARQVVRQQMQQWRQARRPVRQPDMAVAPVTRAATPAAAIAGEADAAPPARASTPAPAKAAAAPRRSEARLEIVPAAAPGTANGTRTGTAAGGEGNMQQQLRQRDEDIAAKTAEISELKERVAELERLKDEQQTLISLKDSELAAAQQRLQEVRTAPAAAATPAAAQQTAAQPGAAPQPAPASSMQAWWLGLGLLAAAGLAWLLFGRRKRNAPAAPARKLFDSEALAASMVPKSAPAATPVVEPAPVPAAQPEPAPAAPNWHADSGDVPPPVSAVAGVPPQATVAQRFKLARAFMDVGDDDSARQLLRELLDDADPDARADAARMLRELD